MFDAFVGLVPLPRIRPTFFTPTTPGAWIFIPWNLSAVRHE